MNKVVPDMKYKVSFTNGKGHSEFYETQGACLLSLERNMYSNTFMNLLMRCLTFNPADRPSLQELKRVIDGAIVILNAEEEKLRNPYFDSMGRNLKYHRGLPEHEFPVKPHLPPRFSLRGSLQLDYTHRTPDSRARVDAVSFAQAGSASDMIGGNTAMYSVQPVKYDLLPATVKVKDEEAARDKPGSGSIS